MPTKIRLQRMGKRDHPHFRIVVAEEGVKRGGKTVANLGYYNPETSLPTLNVDKKKLEIWLANGAQMTDAIRKLTASHSEPVSESHRDPEINSG